MNTQKAKFTEKLLLNSIQLDLDPTHAHGIIAPVQNTPHHPQKTGRNIFVHQFAEPSFAEF